MLYSLLATAAFASKKVLFMKMTPFAYIAPPWAEPPPAATAVLLRKTAYVRLIYPEQSMAPPYAWPTQNPDKQTFTAGK